MYGKMHESDLLKSFLWYALYLSLASVLSFPHPGSLQGKQLGVAAVAEGLAAGGPSVSILSSLGAHFGGPIMWCLDGSTSFIYWYSKEHFLIDNLIRVIYESVIQGIVQGYYTGDTQEFYRELYRGQTGLWIAVSSDISRIKLLRYELLGFSFTIVKLP